MSEEVWYDDYSSYLRALLMDVHNNIGRQPTRDDGSVSSQTLAIMLADMSAHVFMNAKQNAKPVAHDFDDVSETYREAVHTVTLVTNTTWVAYNATKGGNVKELQKHIAEASKTMILERTGSIH